MSENVGSIGFELTFDGSKMMNQINAFGEKIKKNFSKSFSEAGKTTKKFVETNNAEIQAILDDSTRSAKSKAASIAAIYKKEGNSMSEAMEKAWSHIERGSADGVQNVKKGMKSMSKQSQTTASEIKNNLSGAFTTVAKKTATLLITAFSVKKLVDFGKQCLELGSDLQEVQNVVDVTFSSMSAKVDAFAKNAANSFGLSETMAKKYAGTFGAMAKAFGFSQDAAYDMGTALTGLAGDVASFYNLSQDEAYTKLKSVFTGETESLKELGVVMTQNALDSYALANGFGKTTKSMSEAEKVALRYSFVQNQLSAAQGDFIRTSNSWANQVRVLGLQFESLKATIGQGLIAAFTPVIKVINLLLQKIQVIATAFKNLMEGIFGEQSAETDVFSNAAISASQAAADTATSTGKAAENLKKASRFLAGFDVINKMSDSYADSPDDGTAVSGSSVAVGSGSNQEQSVVTSTSSAVGKLQNLLNFLKEKFSPVFTDICNKLSKPIEQFKENFKKVAGDLQELTQSFIDYMTGPFLELLIAIFEMAGDICVDFLDIFNVVFEDIWKIVAYPFLQKLIKQWIPGFTRFTTKLVKALSELSKKFKKIFDALWEDTAKPAIELIIDIFMDFADLLEEFWDEWAEPIFDNLQKAFEKTSDALQCAWNQIIKPIFDKLMVAVDEIWEEHLAPLMGNFLGLVGEFIDGAFEIYNKFIVPIVKWLIDVLEPAFDGVFGFIIDILSDVVTGVIDAVNRIITTIRDIIQFIGEFKENWNQAWNEIKNICKNANDGIKNVFSTVETWFSDKFTGAYNAVKKPFESIGTFFENVYKTIKGKFKAIGTMAGDAIGESFKSVINTVLRTVENTINKAIGFINRAITVMNKVPGVNIDKIKDISLPRLAQGGYVKRNTPQLAVIGDNRHQGEVVAPEDKLTEMAMTAVKAASGNDYSLEILKVLKEILEVLKALDLDIVVDGKKLKDIIVQKINQHTIQTGVCEIIQ